MRSYVVYRASQSLRRLLVSTCGRRVRVTVLATIGIAAVAACGGTSKTGSATSNATTTPSGPPRQGGQLTISYKTDVSGLDPATCYDQQCFEAIPLVFQGLYDYDRAGHLFPLIARTMPKITDGGKTWTIPLRHNVTFSTGRHVTAADYVYSVRRLLAPKTATPVTSFWEDLKGAEAYIKGKTTALRGVTALNKYTVQMHLSEPFPPFINVLAMTGSFLVPKEVADREGKNFARMPVGTGPYVLKQWLPGQRIVFARNPHYWRAGLPHLDRITYQIGVDPDVALLKLKDGQLDLLGDGIPGAAYPSLLADPKWSKNIHRGKVYGLVYLSMNTQHYPLSNKLVRQAVAYAINRQLLVKLIAGRGAIADHYYAPGIPGRAPDAPTYTFNVARAKQLMHKAGVSHATLTLTTENVAPYTTVAQAIQNNLSAIGIHATINSLPINDTYSVQGKASYSGMGINEWYADFPDPWDLVNAFLTSASAVNGGINFAFYKNAEVDRLNAAGAREINPTKRLQDYQQIERTLLTDMPWVPLYYPYQVDLHSPQLHMFTNPIWIYSFENYWKG